MMQNIEKNSISLILNVLDKKINIVVAFSIPHKLLRISN